MASSSKTDTWPSRVTMSLTAALSRINEIQTQLHGSAPQAAPAAAAQPAALTGTVQPAQFAQLLQQAQDGQPVAQAAAAAPAGSVGAKMVELARAELARGVTEGNGDNDSADIARYRTATDGAVAGAPWCAYFVSYIAQQAGVPIGPDGSGMGYCPAIIDWAKQTGKWTDASVAQPQPGDVILFDNHIGIVEAVGPNGEVTTIEGNSSDAVVRRENRQDAALGYVRLG